MVSNRSRFTSTVIFLAVIALIVFWPRIGQSQGTHSNTLSWTAPTTGGAVATYNVKRSASAGTEVTIATVPSTQTSFVDTTGTAGTTYFYVVSASNQFGESPNSNEVSALFLGDKPAAPSGLAVVSK
jgi:cellulose 1,4-beta-cellobiosidase